MISCILHMSSSRHCDHCDSGTRKAYSDRDYDGSYYGRTRTSRIRPRHRRSNCRNKRFLLDRLLPRTSRIELSRILLWLFLESWFDKQPCETQLIITICFAEDYTRWTEQHLLLLLIDGLKRFFHFLEPDLVTLNVG